MQYTLYCILQSPITRLWEQSAGVVQRGKPQTLVLCRLDPKLTVKRAPGLAAIRKREWKALDNKPHTDSAKSYKFEIDGIVHDRVVHAQKRVNEDGKYRWQKPRYDKLVKRKIPNTSRIITVKSGTQIIDRAFQSELWCENKVPRAKRRSAQYEYGHKNYDLWLHCGMLCSHNITKLVGS